MNNGRIQAKDQPGPSQVLHAVRQALFDDSSLRGGAPLERIARQLVSDGYLSEEPSLVLVQEVLKILEEGGFGLRRPTLQPCSLEFFWDDEAGRLMQNMNLSMSVEWVGAPGLLEERLMPEELTHTRTPPCTDLISEPRAIFANKHRQPSHVCYEEFLRQSTELWAQSQTFITDSLSIYRWASMHPLPIGRRAFLENGEVDCFSEWSEVLNVLPFEDYEAAVWALRVEVGGNILDLFGLEDYPTELHKNLGFPVAGDLAYVLRGRDTSLTDLVHRAERWWSLFRGRSLRGRPRGSGTWEDADAFRDDGHLALS